MLEKVNRGETSRSAFRSFSSAAVVVKPDTQGRIVIPSELREYAGLENDVMVIGASPVSSSRTPPAGKRPTVPEMRSSRAQLTPDV